MKKFVFFILSGSLMFVYGVAFCDSISTSTVVHKATETYKNTVNIPQNKIIVYPNPWIPESGISGVKRDDEVKKNTLKHGHLSAEGWIKFAGMQQKTGTLRIYDVTGNLVRNFRWDAGKEGESFPVAQYEFSSIISSSEEYHIDYYETQEHYDKETNGYKIIHWDGKDNNYEYVKSGVYIWILTEDGGRSHHGKIAIVR